MEVFRVDIVVLCQCVSILQFGMLVSESICYVLVDIYYWIVIKGRVLEIVLCYWFVVRVGEVVDLNQCVWINIYFVVLNKGILWRMIVVVCGFLLVVLFVFKYQFVGIEFFFIGKMVIVLIV